MDKVLSVESMMYDLNKLKWELLSEDVMVGFYVHVVT